MEGGLDCDGHSDDGKTILKSVLENVGFEVGEGSFDGRLKWPRTREVLTFTPLYRGKTWPWREWLLCPFRGLNNEIDQIRAYKIASTR